MAVDALSLNATTRASASPGEGEMGVAAETWLDLIDREYLHEFISGGGSAVKFVEADAEELDDNSGAPGRACGTARARALPDQRV